MTFHVSRKKHDSWALENRFKLRNLLFNFTRSSVGIRVCEHRQLTPRLTAKLPGSVLAGNLCSRSSWYKEQAGFLLRTRWRHWDSLKEARKTKHTKNRADRAHQKAETANRTAVNKDERLKYGIKKGSGNSPEELCLCLVQPYFLNNTFNSITQQANKPINLDLYHQ